jgi:enamine deaminase RidA (YjgF/YER057c/UK114 family)
MKVYLKLPIKDLTEALIEATGEHVTCVISHRGWVNTPEEWEDQFNDIHDRFTDLVPDGHVEVEFDLMEGTARVLLDRLEEVNG